ncbi:asparaginase [Clostridium sp. AM58-1XD]|uniref:asparaginase n=1 Tax=Clostridium sp. AM58-1XD TaxID=2292307 RepID=UPI000E4A0958|nr:asparaginase [Clostridium sp. AM58-1XD]RGY97725.1 asparaginase [Clostridium sp. AM58-1XD]
MAKKKILLLNTGGTFSSVKGAAGFQPGLGRQDILEDLMLVAKDCLLEYEDICSLDSANITPKHWKSLAERIADVSGRYEGIVVIHGTDTMAYTASMLSFMLYKIGIPVVITGSQLSIAHPVADAMENCRAAIYMAASGYAGVYVAFNRKIMLGTRVSKIRTMSFDAFESINYPYAAVINAYGMEVNDHVLPRAGSKDGFRADTAYSDQVALVKIIPGMKEALFRMLPEMGYKGVVIEAFGLGGLPFTDGGDLCNMVGWMTEAGMAVVVGSQCRYDGSSLSVYETGKRALQNGAVQMYDMTTEAAVTKLMWLLGHDLDIEEVKRRFVTPICGDIMPGRGE